MAPNAFIGRMATPTDADLVEVLGPVKPIWDRLIADLAEHLEVATQEWSSYSPKAGWALRLKRGKRTIVWLSPCRGCFRAMFILGERAVEAARRAKLPAAVIRALDNAKKYPEGTGLPLVVKGLRDVPAIEKLARVKLES